MSQYDKITRALVAQPIAPPSEGRDDWLDAEALFRVIRRQVGLILLVGALVVLASLPAILGIERSYTSTTRILVHEPLPVTLSSAELNSDQGFNLATESERLLSREISVAVIRELGLDELPEFNSTLREVTTIQSVKEGLRQFVASLTGSGGGAEPTLLVDPMDQIVPEYLGHLRISRASGSDVINIDFTSKSSDLAAQVPNQLIRSYLAARANQVDDRVASAERWLTDRIKDQAARLTRANAALKAVQFSSEVALADTPAVAQSAVAELAQSAVEIERARTETRTRIAALRDAETLEEKVAAADSEAIARLAQDLSDARRSFARLGKRYGPAHAEVVAAGERMQELEAAIDMEAARAERGLSADLASLERRAELTAEELAAARARFADLRTVEERLALLRDEARSERLALDQLTSQRRDLRDEAQLPATEVEVLSPASVSLIPDGHGRAYYVVLAGIAAALIAFTCAFLREMLDKSIRSHEQLDKIPALRPAGSLPAISLRRSRRNPGIGRGTGHDGFRNAVQGVLLALEQRGAGSLPESLLVTSALPHEGRTTLAAALAKEIVASGRRVLLVDADLHCGVIGKRLGLPSGPGLGDYLSGKAALSEIIVDHVPEGLAVVPRGDGGEVRPADRQKIRNLIADAVAEDRVVVFDAAPALVANDTLLLAGIVSRSLLVVRWGRTDQQAVEAAAERMSIHASGDIDVVINGMNLRRQALYGYRDAGIGARELWKYYRAPVR